MAKKAEKTIEEKLKDLVALQNIYSKLDEINKLKGELPLEVRDLEDEILGLEKRVARLKEDREDLEDVITTQRMKVKESEALTARYEEQLNNVKNSREFDALNKEIEMQKLEQQLAEKRIREAEEQITAKNAVIEESEEVLKSRQADLEVKKKELEKISAETLKEEKSLAKKAESKRKEVEERYLKAFDRIRKAYANGLAVVIYERDSCGGCHAKIPTQKQVEIRQHKKIIICEHCGRILVDPELAEAIA